MAGEIPWKTGVGDSQGCRGLWEGSEESLKGVSNMQTNNGELLGVIPHQGQAPTTHFLHFTVFDIKISLFKITVICLFREIRKITSAYAEKVQY